MRRHVFVCGFLLLVVPLLAGCKDGNAGVGGSGKSPGKRPVLKTPLGEPLPKLIYKNGKPTFNFDKMGQETIGHHTFEVSNDGPGNLQIRLADTTCGCTSVKFAHLHWEPKKSLSPPDDIIVLRPGEVLEIEVTWNTEMKFGPFRTTAHFETNDIREPVPEFVIEGEIMSFVESTQSQINLVNARNGDTTTTSFIIYSKVLEDLEITEVTSSSEKVKSQVEPAPEEVAKSMNALRAYKCTVNVEPGVPIGPFAANVVVRTNCEQRPELIISLSGTFVGDVMLNPDRLDFGHVTAGQRTSKFVIVTARSDAEVEMKVKRVVPDFLKPVLKKSESGRNRYRLEVEIPADAKDGPFQGGVELETNHPGCESVKLPIRGTVVDPLDAAATVTGSSP